MKHKAKPIDQTMKKAKTMESTKSILVNLSGRGDKDADFVAEKLGL